MDAPGASPYDRLSGESPSQQSLNMGQPTPEYGTVGDDVERRTSDPRQSGVRRNRSSMERLSDLAGSVTDLRPYFVMTDQDADDPAEFAPFIHTEDGSDGSGGHDYNASAKGASYNKTRFTIMKAFVGSGVLLLPDAYANGGYLFSSITHFVFLLLVVKSTLLLVECRVFNGGSYGQIAKDALGKPGQAALNVSIILSQLGFATAYLIFNAQVMYDLMDGAALFGTKDRRLVQTYLILLQLPFITPMVWIRKVKVLSYLAILADVCIVFGLCVVYTYDAATMVHCDRPATAGVSAFNKRDFALFLGTAIYTFEGQGLIIPIYDSMEEQSKFPSLFVTTLMQIGLMFISFGLMGYLAYGPAIETNVVLSLPHGHTLPGVTQVLYVIALLCTYPLQFFPATMILESNLFTPRGGRHDACKKWKKNIFRAFLVGTTAAVAALGLDNFGNFVSFIGALCCVPICFIYPALFHMKIFGAAGQLSTKQYVIDMCYVVTGVCLMCFCTYQSIDLWIQPCPNAAGPGDQCNRPVSNSSKSTQCEVAW